MGIAGVGTASVYFCDTPLLNGCDSNIPCLDVVQDKNTFGFKFSERLFLYAYCLMVTKWLLPLQASQQHSSIPSTNPDRGKQEG